jgi:hypothetical protein
MLEEKKIEFLTAEEMIEFYDKHRDEYMLVFGEKSFKLYKRKDNTNIPESLVCEIIDDRAAVLELQGLQRRISW